MMRTNMIPACLLAVFALGMAPDPILTTTSQESDLISTPGAEGEASNEAIYLGACPGVGSCCTAHAEPGCEASSCCESVCGAEPFCCFAFWDADCASLAQTLCGSLCGSGCPGEGDCCQAHTSGGGCSDALCCDLVCTRTPSCCEAAWSSGCAELAVQICEVCEPAFVCPQPGDCCTGRLTPGCERAACCEIVCALDEFCCTSEWDSVCARKAGENCPNICECAAFGDFDDRPAIDLRDAARFLNCFSGETTVQIPVECACADYDGDGDADLTDYAAFAAVLGGP